MTKPVLVLIDHDRGVVDEASLQAVAFARAVLPDSPIAAVVIGADAPDDIGGVDAIWRVVHDELTDYAPEAWGDALHQVAVQEGVAAVTTTGTERGNEVLAHVAAIAGEAFAANVVRATAGSPWQVRRMRWGGSLLEDATLTARLPILSCALHAYSSDAAAEWNETTPTAAEFVPELGPDAGRTRIVDRVQVAEGITLTTAPVVVSGGRGVGSEEGFAAIEALAELLGAAVGCSRVVTNQGWRPHADQVGQTGKRVAPDLYIACGISGAIQHWVGMQAAKHVLAINTDPDAPMVTKADYAVIGDLHEIVPAIVEELRRRRRECTRVMAVPTISCRGLWKVFGPHPERIVGSADADLPRAELEARTGCVAAVRDVSFDVPEGDVFVVMGLSGSGKSTLVRCLSRLIEPTAGNVVIDGEDIATCSPEWLRELRRDRVSMVFQHFGLLPHRRVLDNVAFGLEVQGKSKTERLARAGDMLDLVGLSGLGDSYPDELSGGMQQRVGLARALANDPEILLFDEPFSTLDPLIRRDMQDEVERLQRELEKTVVFITHDLQEALKLGDRIAIMRDGRFVQVDTPEAVVAHPVDDYVRDFVRDVPRSHVLTAGGIMGGPLDAAATTGTVASTALVSELLPIVVATDRPIAVLDDRGRVCGAIDRLSVLQALADA